MRRSTKANDQSRKTDAFELVRFLYTRRMAKLSTVPNMDSNDIFIFQELTFRLFVKIKFIEFGFFYIDFCSNDARISPTIANLIFDTILKISLLCMITHNLKSCNYTVPFEKNESLSGE
ncbi:hypothetical protein BpHYR1_010772 [Brachionus plicatilis]|uniref:Uncharacterized protein n=1 Tax=Brachionus plicatilis TaxID=10195 RepID=A0A3M7Q721_BRAPC|nr:hypothetical protein BpHYR1_010772 [Brachionus plicatilis]